MPERRLTERQRHFAREYLRCGGNGAEAYRRAYPGSVAWKDHRARKKASDLLSRGDIQGTIAALRAKLERPSIATQAEVCEILTKMVRAKPATILHPDGTADLDAIRACEQELGAIEIETTPLGVRHKVKFRDAVAASERLAKIMGWDKPTETRNVAEADAIRAALAAMNRQERAEWLRQHLLRK